MPDGNMINPETANKRIAPTGLARASLARIEDGEGRSASYLLLVSAVHLAHQDMGSSDVLSTVCAILANAEAMR